MSSEPTGTSGFAGRYAAALFELAEDSGAIDAVADDLANLQELIETVDELVYLIRSPQFSRDEQGRAMDAVLDAVGISDLTHRFIGVVVANRRLFALTGMIQAYRALLARHRGEVSAEVTSAAVLSEAQLAAQVGGPQVKGEGEGAEIAVRGGENGLAQEEAHPQRPQEVARREARGEASGQPHMMGRQPGGMGSGPLAAALSYPQAQDQQVQPENERRRLEGGMKKR